MTHAEHKAQRKLVQEYRSRAVRGRNRDLAELLGPALDKWAQAQSLKPTAR